MGTSPARFSAHEPATLDSDCSMASFSSTPRHIIKLSPADLDVENPALIDFIKFSRHVIDQTDAKKAARYAGMLYLALVSAFEAAGMVEYEWVPALNLEIQSMEYEVSCSDECADVTDPAGLSTRRAASCTALEAGAVVQSKRSRCR